MDTAPRNCIQCPICCKGFTRMNYMRYQHLPKAHPIEERQPPIFLLPDARAVDAFTSALVGEILSSLSPSRRKVGMKTLKMYVAEDVFAHVFGAHMEYSLSRRKYVGQFWGVKGREDFTRLLGVPGDLEMVSARGVRTFLKAGANGQESVISVSWCQTTKLFKRRGDHLAVVRKLCTCTFDRARR